MFKDAFTYPLRGSGKIMILIGSVFAVLLKIGSIAPLVGFMASVFAAGYFASFYFDVISATIAGQDTCPDWPSLSDFWDDIMIPFVRVVGAVILSFLPLIICVFAIHHESPAFIPAIWAGIAFGCLYFPMAILAIVLFGNLSGALPNIVIPALFRCMPGYLLVVGVLVLVFIISSVAEDFADRVFLVGWFLSAAISLYFLMVQARLIGLLYIRHQERIGWT
jgi:hypothetical protein